MSNERREELRRFLQDRRARITPADVGLPVTPRRRVPGLRREEVASLAGIGVSWYTALENGDAENVSEATLLAVAGTLHLSESEREYLLELAVPHPEGDVAERPDSLVVDTVAALRFPAYVITATWELIACNRMFCRVWGVAEREVPFNTIERMFLVPHARAMHGANFIANIAPVIAMFRSGIGRRPASERLRALRSLLLADPVTKAIWNAYDIRSPRLSNRCTIDSPIGHFTYETITLGVPGASHGIVVQVPDAESRALLESDGAGRARR